VIRYFILVVENASTAGILSALLFAAVKSRETAGLDGRAGIYLGRACAAGVLLSLVVTVLRRTTALINRTRLNTWILSAAIIAAVLFLVMYWKDFSKHAGPRRRLYHFTGAVLEAALLFYTLPTIFLYPAEFVLAGQSVLSTDFLFKLIGFSAGLVLTILVSVGLFKSAADGNAHKKIPGIFLSALLVINMLNQLSAILQFLLARRIIPMIGWLFDFIVIALNYNIVFLYTLLGAAVLIPIMLFVRYLHPRLEYKNPAELRKLKAGIRRKRRWAALVVFGFCCSVLSFTVLRAYNERGVVLSPAEPMSISGGEIRIPIEQIEDGHLHRFAWNASDGTEVRFIVIKKGASAYGVGLDACDICGNTGYYERRDEVICRLCDVVMNKSTIGFKGGCNPVPLAYAIRDGAMSVLLVDLENEKGRFQ
jgi:uncharacterized membrane protein